MAIAELFPRFFCMRFNVESDTPISFAICWFVHSICLSANASFLRVSSESVFGSVEVARLIASIRVPKHRAVLLTLYLRSGVSIDRSDQPQVSGYRLRQDVIEGRPGQGTQGSIRSDLAKTAQGIKGLLADRQAADLPLSRKDSRRSTSRFNGIAVVNILGPLPVRSIGCQSGNAPSEKSHRDPNDVVSNVHRLW